MHRFFINTYLIKGKEISLENPTFHQIKNVLRMAEGDYIELFNNTGNYYKAKIIDSEGNLIKCLIEDQLKASQDGIEINVYQSIIKISKLELIVDKLTEIGISSFTPIITERTQKKDIDSLSENKLKRLKKISIEASEQSGKVYIPKINSIKRLRNLDIGISNILDIVFYENNDNAKKLNYLKSKFSDKKSISAFIGPVGGFSIEEIEYFKSKESIVINLGNTIFKSDTASIISVALLRNLISGNLD
tara:strand:- start:600 stop:1340 length:741 start_codon:yes stop_codon:yes gene_type:complete